MSNSILKCAGTLDQSTRNKICVIVRMTLLSYYNSPSELTLVGLKGYSPRVVDDTVVSSLVVKTDGISLIGPSVMVDLALVVSLSGKVSFPRMKFRQITSTITGIQQR